MFAYVSNLKAAIRQCIFARNACGDVASEPLSGSFMLAARSEGPSG